MTEISATIKRKINYQSDFDFLLRLTDSEGEPTGFPSYDWRLELFAKTGYGKKYTASSVGGVLTNCFDDNGAIRVVCDNHNLGIGELYGKFYADIPNSIYADGIQLTVTPFSLGITLTTEASDDAGEFEVENAVPIAIVTAYQMAVANGYTGTKEEYVSAISEMPGMVAAMAATIETLRSNVNSLQELTAQTSDEVFIVSDDMQGLTERMRMKADVSDVTQLREQVQEMQVTIDELKANQ